MYERIITQAIHNCDSCGKSFTTKFNLKRHINMHCHKSKEAGVPVQGPPSASAPAKKSLEGLPPSPHLAPVLSSPPAGLGWGGAPPPPPALLFPDMVNNNQVEAAGYQPPLRPGLPQLPHDYGAPPHPPEPDTTYRLPSVQTLLPISSTVYTLTKPYTSPFHSPPSLCSPPPNHNTDFGVLPADLFEPDSSESAPPSPSYTRDCWGETGGSLPSSPSSPMVMLTAVPPGWSRRVVVEHGRPAAKYFNPIGKRFSCYEEVAAYFHRQNFSVPRHLFTFGVEEDLEDNSSEESDLVEDSEGEEEGRCMKRRRKTSGVWEEMAEMVAPPWSPPAATPAHPSIA